MLTRRELARCAGISAGELLHKMRGVGVDAREKGQGDTVTTADEGSQCLILDLISTYYPGDPVLAEEQVAPTKCSPTGWSIDPLDGTARYEVGDDGYGVSLAYLEDGLPVVGVMYFPALRILVEAGRGEGCTVNGVLARIPDAKPLGRMVVGLDICRAVTDDVWTKIVGPLARSSRYTRVDNAALSALKVVLGHTGLYFSNNACHWDVAAGSLIVEEAGGIAVNGDGQPLVWNEVRMGPLFFFADRRLQEEVFRLLQMGQL